MINNWLGRIWQFLLNQPSCQLFCRVLRGSRPLAEHVAFNYFILFLASASLFIWVAYNTTTDGILTNINLAIFHLMRSLYTPTGEKIATIITMLGEPKALFPLIVTVSVWFMLGRNWRAAWHWLIPSILAIGSAIFFRNWLHLPRPNGLLIPIATPSFPSGHATFNVLFYGMLALLVARELPAKFRSTAYWLASFIAISIMVSRLYLGAHWLSDLLGGTLLALSCVFLAASSYYRHVTKSFSVKYLLIIFFGTLIISWTCYFVTSYHKELQKYAPYWPLQTLNVQEWWMQESAPNALYRTSHFGKPLQAINIQWADSLSDIRKKLLSVNWQEVPMLNLQTAIKHFSKNEDKQLLPPIVPRLYQDRAPVLIMTKLTSTGYPLVLRLWNSYTLFADSSLPLWYGIVEYQVPTHHKKHSPTPLLPANSGLQAFVPYLTQLKWKIVPNSNSSDNDEFLLIRPE